MRHPVLIAALTLTTLGVGIALADDDCDAPIADWQPRSAVQRLAESKGWTIQRIKVDDGCYEIKGQDAKGDDIEVKLHPATLAVVEMETGGDDEDDEDGDDESEDGDAGDSSKIAPDPQGIAPSTNPAPRNPLLNGSSRPSVIVQ